MDCEISKIIVKVLSGEASPKDKQALFAWLSRDPENIKALRQTESIWTAIDKISARDQYDPQQAFEQFKSIVHKEQRREGNSGFKRTLDILLRIAAIVVIVMGISFFVFRFDRKSMNTENALYEVIAPAGSKAQVVLPDGTKIWLNADSKINYRQNYDGDTREVFLEGEGYFEVAKDPDRMFVVNTSDIRIKALGTSFNVKSYPSDKTIVTTLIEGKIVLEQKIPGKVRNEPITLKPNQQATVYKDDQKGLENRSVDITKHTEKPVKVKRSGVSRIVLSEKVNPQLSTAWKNNYLYFDDETFRNLSVKLERRFGVSIQFMDAEIAQYHFTGKFDDVIIEQVLAALQYASPFQYVIRDSNIIIYNQSQIPPAREK